MDTQRFTPARQVHRLDRSLTEIVDPWPPSLAFYWAELTTNSYIS